MKRSITYLIISLMLIAFGINFAEAAAPNVQARYLAFTEVRNTQLSLAWVNGNGAKRIVVAYCVTDNGAANWAAIRTVLNTYNGEFTPAAGDFNTLQAIPGYNNYKVVGALTGAARTLTITNLQANKNYSFHVFEYNGAAPTAQYFTAAGTLNPRAQVTMPHQITPPSSFTTVVNSEGARLTWATDGSNATGYFIDVYNVSDGVWVYSSLDIGLPTGVDGKKYWILGLTNAKTYWAFLRSYDANRNVSPNSDLIGFTTTATPAYSITSWSVESPTILGLNASSNVVLTTSPLQTGLRVVSSTINELVAGNVPIDVSSTFVETSEGVYRLTYTAAAGHRTQAAGGALPIYIRLRDSKNTPGIIITASGVTAPGVDVDVPTISGVTSADGDATYKIGDVVNVQLTLSKNVNFTANGGTLQLELETGATNRFAVASVDQLNSTTIDLSYTVQAGDEAADLDYVATGSLTLTGGATLKDLNGNNAVLDLAVPGAVNSLGNNQDIVIDGIKPTISSISYFIDIEANGLGGVDVAKVSPFYLNLLDASGIGRFAIQITFSENMGVTEPTLTFDPALAANLVIHDASSEWVNPTTYIAFYDITSNAVEVANVDVNISLAADVAGNVMVADNRTDQFHVDMIAPSVVVARKAITNGTNWRTNDDNVAWTLDFSEKIKDLLVGGITPAANGVTIAGTNTLTEVDADAGIYDYTLVGITGNGTPTISIEATAFTDIAGNQMDGDFGPSDAFTIDNVAPTVTVTSAAVTLGSAFKTSDNNFVFDIAFSEVIDHNSFTASDDISESLVDVNKTGESLVDDGDHQNFTYNITGVTGNGTLTISVINNGTSAIKDLAGNTIVAASSAADETYTIDNTPLAVGASGNVTKATDAEPHKIYYFETTYNDNAYTNSNTTGAVDINDFTLTFDAGSYGTAIDATLTAIKAENETTTSSVTNPSAGDQTITVFYTVNGTANGTETVTFAPATASSVFDDAGNGTPTSVTVVKTLTDETAPVVSSISDGGATIKKPTDEVTITFTVVDFGGLSGDPVVQVWKSDNSAQIGVDAVKSSPANPVNGTYNYTYTFAVPDVNEIDVRIKVTATDNAGLSHTLFALNQFNIDNAAPTVLSVTPTPGLINTLYNEATSFELEIVFSETMKTDVAPTITFTDAITAGLLTEGAGSWSTTTLTNDTYTQHYTVDKDIIQTNIDIDVTIGAASDLAGNVVAGVTTTQANEFTIDTEAPANFTVGTVVATGGTVKAGYLNSTNTGVSITVPLVTADLTLTGGTIQIKASKNAFVAEQNLGVGAYTILHADRIAGEKVFSFNDEDIEGLVGYAEGDVWEFRAVLTDVHGNAKVGTKSANSLTIDQAIPTLSDVTISSNNAVNTFAKADNVITLTFTGSETLKSKPTVTIEGHPIAAGSVTNTIGNVWQAQYTVVGGDADGAVDFTIDFFDANENPGVQVTLADVGSVTIDNTAPVDQAMGAVLTLGAPVVAGYWNNLNTGMTVAVNLEVADATLENGTAKIQMQKKAGGAWTDIANASSAITNGQRAAGLKTFTISKADFEANAQFVEGATIQFRAVVTDRVGNTSNWTTAATELIVDQTAPTAPTVTLNGGAVINSLNHDEISLTIAGEVDATYSYSISSNNGGAPVAASGALDASPKTLTLIDVSGLNDGTLTASVTLTDAAGNVSNADQDTETKNAAPATITNVTATNNNATYGIEQTITVQVTFNKNVTFTPNTGGLKLALNPTGDAARFATSTVAQSGDNTLELTYQVHENDVAADLNYTLTTDLVLEGDATIVDADLNPVITLTLPAIGGASLGTNKNIVIDGVKPTFALQYFTLSYFSGAYGDNPKFSTTTPAYLRITASKPLSAPPVVTINSDGSSNDVNNVTATHISGNTVYRISRPSFQSESGTNGQVRETISISGTSISGSNPVVASLSEAPAVSSYITAGTTVAKLGFIDCTPPTFETFYYTNSNLVDGAIANNAKLKPGTYYIKIVANEVLDIEPPTISIDAEGTLNDVNNVQVTLVGDIADKTYTYTRVIVDDNAAVGTTAETRTITGTDAPGNIATASIPTNALNIFTDTQEPEINLVTIASDNTTQANRATTGNEVTITLTSNETLTGVTVNALTSGGAPRTNAPAVSNVGNVWSVKYTVNVADTDGPIAFNLTATDVAGNETVVTAINDGDNVTVDKGAPTVTTLTNTTSIGADRYAKTNETITVALTPSEDVEITSATIGGKTLTVAPLGGFNAAYTMTYETDGSETEGLQALSIAVKDRAGNTATFTHGELTGGSLQIIYDKTAPAIVAASITAPTSATIWNPGNHNITWTTGNISDAGGSGLAATPVSFEYYNGTEWVAIAGATNIANTSPYEWAVPNVTNTDARIKIIVKDNAGNETEQLSDIFKIDNVGPVYTLTNNISKNEVKAAQTVTITATFADAANTAINEGTVPAITITNGNGLAADLTANMSKSTNTVWTYEWTVPAGNHTSNVTVAATDVAGNVATATLGAHVNSYIVDNTRPNVTLFNNVAGRTEIRNADNPLTITATFAEANTIATGMNAPKISIDYSNGTADIVDAAMTVDGGNPKVYHYTWTLPATNETAIVSVSAQDLAGNLLDATTGPTSYTIDNVVPTATITRSNPAGEHTNADQVVWQIVFNEEVQGFTQADITLTDDLAGASAIASLTSGDNITFLLTVNVPINGNGTIGFEIGTGLADLAGNPFAGKSTDGTNIYNVNNTAPTILSIARDAVLKGNDATKTTGSTEVSFTVTFSKAVQNFTSDDITVNKAGVTSDNAVITGGPTTYTATISNIAGDGSLNITVNTSDIIDLAGNALSAPLSSAVFAIDQTPANINSGTNVMQASAGAEYYVDITFNSHIYGTNMATGAVELSDFSPIFTAGPNGTATGITPVAVTQNNSSSVAGATTLSGGELVVRYFFNVDGTASGSETIEINPAINSIFDVAGNASLITATTGSKLLRDETAPVISNIRVNGQNDNSIYLKQGATATITFDIQEVAGITNNPQLTVLTSVDGFIGTPNFVSRTGTGTSGDKYQYTYTLLVGAGNHNNLKVNVNATDNIGFNSIVTLNPAYNIDNTRPEVQSITRINPTDGSNFITKDDEVSFTVLFTEPVLNFSIADISLNKTGTVNDPDITISPVSTSEYTVTLGDVTAITGNGTLGITINQSDITDRATNALLETAARVSSLFTIDNNAPTATVTYNKTSFNRFDIGADALTVTVTYDEPMDKTLAPTFVLDNPATTTCLTAGTIAEWNLAGTVYTKSYNIVDDLQATMDIDITVSGAKDIAQNIQNLYFDDDVIDINLVAPTLDVVSISSNNNGGLNPTWAKVGDIITIAITSNNDLQSVTATIEGNNATISDLTDGNAKTWSASYQMQETDNNGNVDFVINFLDLSGNPGVARTNTSDASAVMFDKTLPVVAITSPAVNSRTNGTQNLVFTVAEDNQNVNSQVKIGIAGTENNIAGPNGGTIAIDAINNGEWLALPDNTSFTVYAAHTDVAGNTHTITRDFIKDLTLPTLLSVSIASDNANPALAKIGDEITLTFTGSEVLVAKPTVTIAGNAINAANVINTGGNNWSATYEMASGDATGNVGFTINFVDLAGNVGLEVASTSDLSAVTFDKTAPQIATRILSTNGNPGYAKVGNTITLDLTADEVISQPTVLLAGISANVTPAGPSNTYQATLVVDGSTPETGVTVSVSGYNDLAGNAGGAYNAASAGAIVVDRTLPSISITSPIASFRTNGTQTLQYTSSDTHLGTNRARISNSVPAGVLTAFATNSAFSTLNGWGNVADGASFEVEVENTDLAGNQTIVTRSFIKDVSSPIADVSYNKTLLNRLDIGTDKLVVTINFNEPMDTNVDPTITFDNPIPTALQDGTTAADWTSSTQFVAYYTINNVSINFEDVDVSVTGAKDIAQNTQIAYNEADAFDVILDGPTLTSVTIASNNAGGTNPTWAKVGDEVTLTFAGSKNLQDVIVTINGVNATVAGAGQNWTAWTTMTSGMTEGNVQFAISYKDLSNNPGDLVTAITSGSNVNFDKTLPIINITAPLANARVNNRQVSFSIIESNIGSTTASANASTYVAFANNALANTLGGFAGLPEGAFTATIRHSDLAGNVGQATINLVKDVTAPTISAMTLSCNNAIVNLTFSEGVYGTSNGNGQISDAKLSATRGGSGSQITTKTLTPVPAAGSSTAVVSLIWNGDFTGNEIVTIDAANNTSIYDEAGNALLTGTPVTHYTNIPIAITQQPQNASVCVNGNTSITMTAVAGNSVAYQWQKFNGSTWDNLSNDATYSNVNTNTLVITNADQSLSGSLYKVLVSNACFTGINAVSSTSALLTVNPNTTIATHPASVGVCVGEAANLSVTPSSVGPFTYIWKFFNGAIWVNAAPGVPAGAVYTGLNTSSISVSGLASGTYNYRVDVQGGCGPVVFSNTAVVNVNFPPDVAITAGGSTTICDGTSVLLTAGEPTAVNIAYQWRLNGNPIALATNRTYNANQAGNYTVTVTNTSNGCAATTAIPTAVVVTPLPNASIIEGNTIEICGGTNTILTATEDGATSYNWFKVGDELTSLGSNRTLTVSTSGTYKVTVVKNACSSTTSVGTTVTVNPLPVPVVTGPNNAITGSDIVLSTESDQFNYVWTVDGGVVTGSSTSSSITVKWATSGNKSVTVTYTDEKGCNPVQATSYVVAVTDACENLAFTTHPTATQTVCEDSDVTLSVALTGTAPYTYSWYKENGLVDILVGNDPTLELTTIDPSEAGTYYVVVENDCSEVTSQNAVVNVTPKAATSVAITLTSGTNPTCSGNSVTFTANPTNGGTPTYQWKVNNINVGTGLSTYTYTPQNGDIVKVEMTSSLTCVTAQTVTSNTITMTVNPIPNAPVANNVNATYTGSAAANLTVTGEVGATFNWYSNVGLTNLVHTGSSFAHGNINHGTYMYYVTQTVNGCTSSAATATVTINKASLDVTAENKTKVYGTSDPTLTYAITGFVGGQTLATSGVTGVPSLSRAAGNDVNNYIITITPNTLASSNYSFNMVNGNFEITKATLTVTADSKSKCQGAANPALTYQYSGFVYSDNSGVIDTPPIIATTALVGSPAGSYPITLSGGLDNNYTFSFVNSTLTVNPLPNPTITGNVTVTLNSPIVLTTQPGMTAYSWVASDLGAITNGNTNSASITWNSLGFKTVTVAYTNGNGCTNMSAIYQVEVVAGCVAVGITTQPQTQVVCAGENVTFSVTASGTAPITYAWYKVGSGTVLGTNSSYTITNAQAGNAGQYYVVVNNSCPSSITSSNATLTVNALPTAVASNNGPKCIGESVTLSATGGVSYSWSGPSGFSSNLQNPTTTVAGTYTVTVTNANGCQSTAQTTVAAFNALPTASASNNGPKCVGESVTLSATGGVSYSWSGPSGYSSVLQNPTTTIAGVYTVTVTNASGCQSTAQTTVPAFTTAPTISSQPTNTSVSLGGNTSFTVTANGANEYKWYVSTNNGTNWSLIANNAVYSNSATATLNITSVTSMMNGYRYKVEVINTCGALESSVATLKVLAFEPPSQPSFMVSSPNASTIVINNITPADSASIGAFRLVVVRQSAVPNAPVDTNRYTANTVFGSGSNLGNLSYVVVDSNTTSVTVSGLSGNTSYHVAIFGYNRIGFDPASYNYNTNLGALNGATSNYKSVTTKRKIGTNETEPYYANTFDVSPITPNPVSNEMNFVLNSSEATQFNFELFNSIGEVVYTKSMNVAVGTNNIQLHITVPGKLPAGKYNLRIINGYDYIDQQVMIMP